LQKEKEELEKKQSLLAQQLQQPKPAVTKKPPTNTYQSSADPYQNKERELLLKQQSSLMQSNINDGYYVQQKNVIQQQIDMLKKGTLPTVNQTKQKTLNYDAATHLSSQDQDIIKQAELRLQKLKKSKEEYMRQIESTEDPLRVDAQYEPNSVPLVDTGDDKPYEEFMPNPKEMITPTFRPNDKKDNSKHKSKHPQHHHGQPPQYPYPYYPQQQQYPSQPQILMIPQNEPKTANKEIIQQQPQNEYPAFDPQVQSYLMQINQLISKTNKKNQKLKEDIGSLSKLQQQSYMAPPPLPPTPVEVTNEIPIMKLAQNQVRTEGMDEEEKALANLAAQECDSIRLLSQIDSKSEIYQIKLQQYKELSDYRAQMEIQIQKHKIEKLRKAKAPALAKTPSIKTPLQTPYPSLANGTMYSKPPTSMKPMSQAKSMAHTKMSEPIESIQGAPQIEPPIQTEDIWIHWDFVLNLPLIAENLKIVYSLVSCSNQIIYTEELSKSPCEHDAEAMDFNKCIMRNDVNVQGIIPDRCIRLVIEIRHVSFNGQISTLGWSVMNLYDYMSKLIKGLFVLHLFKPPTYKFIDNEDIIKQLQRIPFIRLYLRVCYPGDDIINSFKAYPNNKSNYSLPELLNVIYVYPEEETLEPKEPGDQEPIINSVQNAPVIPLENQKPVVPQLKPIARHDIMGVEVHLEMLDKVKSIEKLYAMISIQENGKLFVKQLDGKDVFFNNRTNIIAVEKDNPIVKINCLCQFQENFYNRYLNSPPPKPEFTLTIVIFSIPAAQEDLLPTDKPIWYFSKLLHNSEGEFLFNKYTVNLYPFEGEISTQPKSQPLDTTMTFIVRDLTLSPKIAQVIQQPLQPKQAEPKEPKEPQPVMPKKVYKSDPNVFIPNIVDPLPRVPFQFQTDSVNIYIDGLRFLPMNCSVTRANARVFDCLSSQILEKDIIIYPSDYTQKYHTFDLRGKLMIEGKSLKNSSVLLIGIECLCNDAPTPKVLGYVVFPLFLNKEGKKILSPTEEESELQEGYFQMPIINQNIFKDFTLESAISSRVPASSLLLRISKAQDIEFPPYSSGTFITNFFSPSNDEQRLMKKILSDPAPILEKEVATISAQSGNNGLESVKAKFDKADNFAVKFIDPTFYFSLSNKGFSVCVDGILDHKSYNTLPCVVIMSMCPPASLYRTPKSNSFVYLASKIAWTKSKQAPRFEDGYININTVKPTLGTIIIIEVVAANVVSQKTVSVGWTVFPLFSVKNGKWFARTGNFLVLL
jgi:hypothetical protein